ncbi:hypothetical protein [Alloyangia pacifica]|uniref:hypothetical protein n=1 Tax=Alloyangia pacifica TaxID=311180 RepID=UPI001CFE53B3|nr:hypothetical protein [Alloyangia pacifica]
MSFDDYNVVRATRLSAAIQAEMLARTANHYAAAMEAAIRLDALCGAEPENCLREIAIWRTRQRSNG